MHAAIAPAMNRYWSDDSIRGNAPELTGCHSP